MTTVKSWAFVVGINTYNKDITGLSPLNGAVADAADFADWALHDDGGGVPPERLWFWSHPAPDKPSAALKAYIDAPPVTWADEDVIQKVADFATPPKAYHLTATAAEEARKAKVAARYADEDAAPEIRRCYVFLSGHGVTSAPIGVKSDPQTCFLMGNFRSGAAVAKGLIPCEDFRRALHLYGFDQVIMFLDCCRGKPASLNSAIEEIGVDSAPMPTDVSWVVGSAARPNKPAFETTKDPIRGAFSKTLLYGLRNKRDETSSTLSLTMLREYVAKNLDQEAIALGQNPVLKADPEIDDQVWSIIAKGEPIPFVPAAPDITLEIAGAEPDEAGEAPIIIDFGGLAADAVLQLVDAKGKPIGDPIPVQQAPAKTIPVPLGRFYGVDVIGAKLSKAVNHRIAGESYVRF